MARTEKEERELALLKMYDAKEKAGTMTSEDWDNLGKLLGIEPIVIREIPYSETKDGKRAARRKRWVDFWNGDYFASIELNPFVELLCRLLKVVLLIVHIVVAIVGGLMALGWVWTLWKAFSAESWQGLLRMELAYLAGYAVALWVINTLRYWLLKMLD